MLNPIQSARLRTANSFSFKYGRVEIRAQLPRGDWIWPAIWMMPRYNAYGGWPASGEIDIMESRGNAPGYPLGGHNAYGSTLHWSATHGRAQLGSPQHTPAAQRSAEQGRCAFKGKEAQFDLCFLLPPPH